MKKRQIIKFIKKYRLYVMILMSALLFFVLSKIPYGLIIGISIISILLIIFLMPFLQNFWKKRKKENNQKGTKKKSQNKKAPAANKNNKIINKKTKDKKPKKGKPIKTKKQKIIKIAIITFLVFVLVSLIGASYFFYLVVQGAPEFNAENLYKKEATVIYDNEGNEIIRIGLEMREKIDYDDLPQVLVDAIIAAEDARFFQHNGFDLPRFLRASTGHVMGDSLAGGGSTLTMQLSYNAFTSRVSTGFEGIVRKFTDIYVSIYQLERHMTKYEIIEHYANSFYLGSSAYGVEQASQTYFGKSARDANLTEAALLAGLFNAPSAFNPYTNPQRAEARRNVVLNLMERHGYISKEERKIAAAISVESLLTTREAKEVAFMSFINTVTEEAEQRTGNNPYVVPMDIYTTMDREKQTHIDNIFNNASYAGFEWENDVVQAGAAVVEVETGAIVAIGAGRNQTEHRTFNFATMPQRHIGSSSKPLYSYGPAIEYNNWSTYQLTVDEPVSYTSGPNVRNWDRSFDGLITLRDALTRSRNTNALKTFQSVTNSNITTFATNLGLSPEVSGNTIHEAHSLGAYNGEAPLSMSAAYAAFANGGYYIEPYSFTKIIYKETGDVYEVPIKRTRVMSEATAYMISHMIVDSARYGLGRYSNINGVQYGAKTGTSNFTDDTKRRFGLSTSAINDLWVAGTSPKYALSVWYGYERIDPDHYTRFGNRRHTHLYQTVGRGIFTDNVQFRRPASVKVVAVEKESYPAQLPSEFTPQNMIITELFKDGTEPTQVSARFSKLETPQNLVFEENGNNVIVRWDAVPTPNYFNPDFLRNQYAPLFRNESYLNSYIEKRKKYNQDVKGDFGYELYVVNGDSERLIGFTKNNHYTLNRFEYSNQTIAIRSVYSKFKQNKSDALTKKYETVEITSSLTTGVSSTLTIPLYNVYTEPPKPVTVLLAGEDITASATITKTIRNSENNVVAEIDTTIAQTYEITYNVSYNGYVNNHRRTIIIEIIE